MSTAITILRKAADAMARDGQATDADWLTREADIAEAFPYPWYKAVTPDPRAIEAACGYQQKGAADGVR